jgi:hypothetical protein
MTADWGHSLVRSEVLRQPYEEIRRLPGGLEDVVRAISILPGVAQVQAGRNDLIVRGGAPMGEAIELGGKRRSRHHNSE